MRTAEHGPKPNLIHPSNPTEPNPTLYYPALPNPTQPNPTQPNSEKEVQGGRFEAGRFQSENNLLVMGRLPCVLCQLYTGVAEEPSVCRQQAPSGMALASPCVD